jgi:hypothetical protein
MFNSVGVLNIMINRIILYYLIRLTLKKLSCQDYKMVVECRADEDIRKRRLLRVLKNERKAAI